MCWTGGQYMEGSINVSVGHNDVLQHIKDGIKATDPVLMFMNETTVVQELHVSRSYARWEEIYPS